MGRLGKTEKGIRRYTRGGKEISFQKVVELMDYTEEEDRQKKGDMTRNGRLLNSPVG